jgi:hypothetical protein
LTSLVDASAACTGTSVGFANGALYSAAARAYSSDFQDITSGNNVISGSGQTLFPAGTAYDMASGLGTPNASQLPDDLCGRVPITNPGPQSTIAGIGVNLPISAVAESGRTLSYGGTGLPAGLSMNTSTGAISGAATTPGTFGVTVTAADNDGNVGSVAFAWTVLPPTVTVSNPGSQTSMVNTSVNLHIPGTDNNGGALSYAASGLPTGLQINGANGEITGKAATAGNYTVTVTANDGGFPGSSQFTWKVVGPKVSGLSLRGVAKDSPSLTVTLSAFGSPRFKKVVIDLPSGLSLTGTSGVNVKGGRKFRLKTSGRKLTISLSKGAGKLKLKISSSSLRASNGLIAKVKHHKSGELVMVFQIKDSSGHLTTLTVNVKPS